ncbi:MAG: hypothetical protein K2H56_03470 [Malacoplasma sp.]|nr:hypothetical protein [Malacoplasma sp.]
MLWKIKLKYYIFKLKNSIKFKKYIKLNSNKIHVKLLINCINAITKIKKIIVKKDYLFLLVGLALAIIGAGTLGGTYGSYQNYQNLNTIYSIQMKYGTNNSSGETTVTFRTFKDFVNNWNDSWNTMTVSQKNELNNQMATSRTNFYQSFPNYSTYQSQMKQADSSISEEQIRANYDITIASMNINYNYNADQAGVIAGAALLAIGILGFIIFLIVLIKNKKKNTENKNVS